MLLPALLLVAGTGLLLVSARAWLLPATTVRVEAAIPKATAMASPAASQVQAAGWIEADPYLHHVSALTSGVIKEIRVLEGEKVTAGAVVASLVEDDAMLAVEHARARLATMEAALAEAEARHEAAEANWQHPVELEQAVTVLAAELEQARAGRAKSRSRLDEQEAVLAQMRRDRERAQALIASGIISEQEAETAQRQVEMALANRDAQAQALQQAGSAIDRMEALAAAARRRRELRVEDRRERAAAAAAHRRARAELQAARIALAEAELRFSRMQICASVGGVVVTLWKAPGDRVMLDGDHPRSATVVSLYDPQRLQVRVDVPLADAAKIAVGQRCEVVSDVLPQRSFAGKVSRILHIADIQKNTLQVKVALDEPSPALRPEILCRVRFLAEAQAQTGGTMAVFAPAEAVRDGRLWLLREFDGIHGRARSLTVAAPPPATLEGWIAVEGLRAGDLVIISSSAPLAEGELARIQEGK